MNHVTFKDIPLFFVSWCLDTLPAQSTDTALHQMQPLSSFIPPADPTEPVVRQGDDFWFLFILKINVLTLFFFFFNYRQLIKTSEAICIANPLRFLVILLIISIVVNSYNIYVMAAKDSWGESECDHTGRAHVAMSPCPKTSTDLGSLSFAHRSTMRLMMATSYEKQFGSLLKEKYNEGSEIKLSVGKPYVGKTYDVLGLD